MANRLELSNNKRLDNNINQTEFLKNFNLFLFGQEIFILNFSAFILFKNSLSLMHLIFPRFC